MILRDRYSQTLFAILIGLVIIYYGVSKDNSVMQKAGYGLLLFAVLRGGWLLFYSGARLHIKDKQLPSDFIMKGEHACFRQPVSSDSIDGVHHNGITYKAVNGTDIYFENGRILQASPISAVLNSAGGGYNHPSIQNDSCWMI